MGFDVVGVGMSAVDYVCLVPGSLKSDSKIQMECFTVQGGGCAATAMVTCARLGLSACLFAKVGADSMGQFQRSELLREGVDVSYISVQEGGTSIFSFIIVDKATCRRSIVNNTGDLAFLREQALDRRVVNSAGCVLVDPYELSAAVRVAGWAREASIPVIFNADSIVEGVSQLVPMADYLIAPLEFATEFARTRNMKKVIDFLLSFGPRVIIITMGEKGALYANRNERFTCPAFPVKTVDTTGAGDVFNGACVLGVLRNWDLRRMVEFASATAALKCTSLGPREGIPRLAEVERFLLHHRPNE